MSKYIIKALSTAVIFGVIYLLLGVLFKFPVQCDEAIVTAVVFGIVVTAIEYIKHRKK